MEETVCSYEPGTLLLSNYTKAEQFFEFSLQVSRQAGPAQRVDCLAPLENKRKVTLSRPQRRTVSLGIEPVVSNLSLQ